jgi:hypothetical protein
VKRAFVLGFYDNLQSELDNDLRTEIGTNVIWFGKRSSHEPFEIGRFRNRLSTDVGHLGPADCTVLLAHLARESYVHDIVREIVGQVGQQHANRILVTNDLGDLAWLSTNLRDLGFPQNYQRLSYPAIFQYFGNEPWECLCVRPKFQSSYHDGLRRADFPQVALSHFVESIEEHNANTIQRILSNAEAYSGVLYAHKGLKYLPPSAREQLRNKRFHEDTTTARVIEKLRVAILNHSSSTNRPIT